MRRPARAAVAAALFGLAGSAAAQQAAHARNVLPLPEDLLERRFADADGDGLADLWLAAAAEDGGRTLRLHRQRADGGFPAEPDETIAVPRAVVCWAVVRLDAASTTAELLFLARDAAFVRAADGRLRRLGSAPMLLDMPADDALPYWPHHADSDGDGLDEIALVTAEGFEILDGAGRLRGQVVLEPATERNPAAERSLFGGSVRATLSSQELSDLFVPDDDVGVITPPAALISRVRQPMPAWADADGDRRLDLTWVADGLLHVLLQREDGGFGGAADWSLDLRAGEDEKDASLSWLDLGGGPADDLLLVREADGGGASFSSDWQVRAWLDPGPRAAPGEDAEQPRTLPAPAAFLKAEASFVVPHAVDFDGDGRLDLGISAWDVDVSVLGEAATRLIHVSSGHLAQPDGGFAARPSFAETREYALADLEAFRDVPAFAADVSGDGRADLIESTETGNVTVRPVQSDGGGFAPAADPVFRIPVDAQAATLEVEDLNRDGLGDFIVARAGFLEVYLSQR